MSYAAADILDSIRSTEVLHGHPCLALRLLELARDPQAELERYAGWIEMDPSLASRLLGLVNSAVYSPGAPILTVPRAVRALGGRSLRELVLAHCVASLHRTMAFGKDEGRAWWRSSMVKAIVARKVAEAIHIEELDAAFGAGLLQDLGLSLLRSLDAQAVERIHGEAAEGAGDLLARETAHFGIDHVEVGRRIAQRLELPDSYFRAITEHHEQRDLGRCEGLELAAGVAGLLPHDSSHWTRADYETLRQLLSTRLTQWGTPEELLGEASEELARSEAALGSDRVETSQLLDALMYASQENARASYTAVYQNTWLRDDANSLQDALDFVERAHQEAEQRAERDPLTQLFNRGGWDRRARVALSQSAGGDGTYGVAFFDLDHFKRLNDEHGHAAGDHFLKEVSSRLLQSVRAEDLVCRWGGDEFVILFFDTNPRDCLEAARRAKRHLESRPVIFEGRELEVSASVGFVTVDADEPAPTLGELLKLADEQLYKAKAVRRGSISFAKLAH